MIMQCASVLCSSAVDILRVAMVALPNQGKVDFFTTAHNMAKLVRLLEINSIYLCCAVLYLTVHCMCAF